MRATKLESPKRRNKSHSSSSISTAPHSKSSSTILDTEFVSEELSFYQTTPYNNPRSFPHIVKQKCWEKAERIKGRDPDRWRRDVLGNTLFRKLVGCPGCLCHDYDHIVPYSKVLMPPFLLFWLIVLFGDIRLCWLVFTSWFFCFVRVVQCIV